MTASVQLAPLARQRFFDAGGAPLAGGKLFTYAPGTTTKQATYTDAGGTTANTNPVVLDARGEAAVWVDQTLGYKFVLAPATDTDPPTHAFWTVDQIPAGPIPTVLGVLAGSASATTGAGAVGYARANAYAVGTAGRKLQERVSVADFLSTTTPTSAQVHTALQNAINSGARHVRISQDYAINQGVTLVANQILDFDGGSLTVDAGTSAPNGLLYANGIANATIADPVIDCSGFAAGTGLLGINVSEGSNAAIRGGRLTRCGMNLVSLNNAVRRGHRVTGLVVDLAGYLTTAIYVSGTRGVTLSAIETLGGKEGIGLYNDALYVRHVDCESHGHTQDGFVIIGGRRASYANCHSRENGQSGFTTQRMSAATNAQDVSYAGCHAYDNTADGFDLRGATSAPWNVDMRLSCVGCVSSGNGGTGFYVVYAEGTVLSGCIAAANAQQGFSVNGSARVTLSACQSDSNASSTIAGTAKAGILFAASPSGQVVGCTSGNPAGAAQQYGVSFTGTSTDGAIVGGAYQNNTASFWNIDAGATTAVSGLAANVSSGVWLNSLNSQTQIGDYAGFSVPTFAAVKGSLFRRVDGGAGELYVSNGGTSWTAH